MNTEYTYFGDFVIELPREMVEDQPTMGACDNHVNFWYNLIDWYNFELSDDQIRAELYEYGAWEDSELEDIVMNRKRMMWLAAGNWQDEND